MKIKLYIKNIKYKNIKLYIKNYFLMLNMNC